METLVILVVIVAVVTVVGHGIWVFLAWLFGAPRRTEEVEASSKTAGEDCIGCGGTVFAGYKRCRWCGLDPHGAVAAELTDLQAAARELTVFREQGTLDAETLDRIQSCIDSRRQEVLDAQASPVAGVKLRVPAVVEDSTRAAPVKTAEPAATEAAVAPEEILDALPVEE